VFEQVGEAGAALGFEAKADAVGDADSDGRGGVIFRDDDDEPIRKFVGYSGWMSWLGRGNGRKRKCKCKDAADHAEGSLGKPYMVPRMRLECGIGSLHVHIETRRRTSASPFDPGIGSNCDLKTELAI
jgi:hypothetical protein